MAKGYEASDLVVLEGLEAVRLRPGMYIGSTGVRGLHHLIWEIVDNAVDEAANGYASAVGITLNADLSVSVTDDGRGIPVSVHPEHGVTGVELVFTRLHAGGKFNSENYAYSGGLHGVGAAVVNALSKWVEVEVANQGILYRQRFESVYDSASKKVDPGKPIGGLENLGRTRRKGSSVTFMPDTAVFGALEYHYETIAHRLRELAFLNRGIRFTLTDARVKGSVREDTFMYEGGISDFVRYLNQDKTVLHATPIVIEGVRDGIHIAAAIQYNDTYTDNIVSYVNNIPTAEGGMHETGFKAALTKAMNEQLRRGGQLKEKESNLAGEDFREGLCAVLTLKMQNVQFEGQTKSKLGNPEARPAVEALIADQLGMYLEDLRNAETVGRILSKAVQAAHVREAARKAKHMARERTKLEGAPLIGKLASCSGRKAHENELFIVEGDSAGGSAKQGRDRRFQAILPLRGKPLNAEKKRLDQVLANEEFRVIIAALGTGIDEDFDIASLKYGKIIILSDADQDGAHIRAILLTFFFRYMRELIAGGHVFIGMPPLYKITRGKTVQYAYSDRELETLTKGQKGYLLQRYKGLGEMNPKQLWETTMDPVHRSLIRVTIEDAAEAEHRVTVLMGDKVEKRKQYISDHADFNRKDTFERKEVKGSGQRVESNDNR
ncbi:MAG: DNA gyrase/topoisomerase IV subunit B [Bacillota bacterium]